VAALVALAVGAAATASIGLSPQIRFAYHNPEFHLVLETAEGLIAFLVAFLMWGRFKRGGSVADLVLVYALTILAFSNLFFSVLPDLTDVDPGDVIRTWTPAATRAIGGVSFAVAALLPSTVTGQARKGLWTLVTAVAGTLLLVMLAVDVLESSLPKIVESDFTASASGRPAITSHTSFTVIQVLAVVPYALAAWGFLRKYETSGDDLMRWLGAGAILSAFARIQYSLYPSLYSELVYTGDLLRLAFYLLLLLGAEREIRSYWVSLAQARVLEERRRLASDLHDGIAQELTYLAGQVFRLRKVSDHRSEEIVSKLGSATDRAVAETRRAIAALEGPIHESVNDAVRGVAQRIFSDNGVTLELDLQSDVGLAPERREGLLRVVREALVNAARHAHASVVRVTLRDDGSGLLVEVIDDGTGFDPEDTGGGFGLITMKERIRAMGGELTIRSQGGNGSTITIWMP
jgi:signal transduction histidine kinase